MSSAGFITYRGKQGRGQDDSIFADFDAVTGHLTTDRRARRGRTRSRPPRHSATARACRSDVLRHCRDMQDQDDYAIADCLKAHERQLSPACRQALKEGGG